LATLFQKHPNLKTEGLKLYVMGSVRNDADQKRVDELMELREELNLTVNICISITFINANHCYL
jgi:hypothetical protein